MRIPKRPSPNRRHDTVKRHQLRQQWFSFLALADKSYNQYIAPLHLFEDLLL